MNKELLREIDEFIEKNKDAMFKDIARLVAVDSVESQAEPDAPYGPGPKKALEQGL